MECFSRVRWLSTSRRFDLLADVPGGMRLVVKFAYGGIDWFAVCRSSL